MKKHALGPFRGNDCILLLGLKELHHHTTHQICHLQQEITQPSWTSCSAQSA